MIFCFIYFSFFLLLLLFLVSLVWYLLIIFICLDVSALFAVIITGKCVC